MKSSLQRGNNERHPGVGGPSQRWILLGRQWEVPLPLTRPWFCSKGGAPCPGSLLRDWIYKQTMAKPYMRVELWPTVYTSCPGNQSPYPRWIAQEASLLAVRLAGNHIHISSNNAGRETITSVTISPIWPGLDYELSTFVPVSNLRATREQQICPLTNHMGRPTSSQPTSNSPGQQPPVRAHLRSPFPPHEAFPLLCLPLSLCQMQMMVADPLAIASSESVAFAFSPLGGLCLFPHFPFTSLTTAQATLPGGCRDFPFPCLPLLAPEKRRPLAHTPVWRAQLAGCRLAGP